MNTQRDQLLRDGFCRFEDVIPMSMIADLRAATDDLLDAMTEEERAQTGSQGAMLGLPFTPDVFCDLIALPGLIDALRELGFEKPRYWSGYVISKEPHTPPSYFHHDWPFWTDPASDEEEPHQLFIMVYLTDTRPENGCLRTIAGSHLKWVPQHDMGGHDEGTRHLDPDTTPAYADSPDQVDLEVNTGDLLIGDARILHGPYGNQTDKRRTVITMWYLPRFDDLSEPMKAAFQNRLNMIPPSSLPEEQIAKLKPLNLDYTGDAEPAEWSRDASAYRKPV